MEINILAVGKVKERYLNDGINEYIKRLRPYTKINIIDISDQIVPGNASEAELKQIKDKEGEDILSSLTSLTSSSYLIVLDPKGKPMTSPGLAKSIQNLQVSGRSSITFIIGGALGLSKNVLKKADYRLSLSHMTFTHQMVRLFLLEQVYRAFKIIRGEPYHL